MREELPGLLWTVFWRNSTTVDAVHPQSGKFQTDRATVQGHMVHSAEVVSWRYKKGERFCSYLAIVTVSSTLPQSMNAVVTMDAINAVDPFLSTDNSGLPLSWQGGLLTN